MIWTRLRGFALGLIGVFALVGIWEGYKRLAPEDGVLLGENRILPRATDLAMPHVRDMLERLVDPVTSMVGADPLWRVVADATWISLKITIIGWVVGVTVGLLLALVMQRFRALEWGLVPWIVLSQTVPLIAFAPVVRSWGNKIEIGGWEWPPEFSVALIASYLAFFPVAIGALKGLQSPEVMHTELLHTYAAGWWATLLKVRLPAAVPYLLPALRLAAVSAVIGTVVAEVSTGYLDGVGRLIISYSGQASGDPAKAWAPIFGAVVLGLVAAAFVELIGLMLKNYRRAEAS